MKSGRKRDTHINDVEVEAGDRVERASGVIVKLNADGTITLISGPNDTPDDISFTYQTSNGTRPGAMTDNAPVTGTLSPCFDSGARIDTARGPVSVEDVVVGDMVLTLDDGLQPVRWCGARQVASRGAFGMVQIPAGTFGDHGALARIAAAPPVSHRVAGRALLW